MDYQIREKTQEDKAWIIPYMRENWGSEKIVTRNTIHEAAEVPGFIAEKNKKPVGIILYNIRDNDCEIVLLASFTERVGIGSALIDSVKRIARLHGCGRVWLITTNDNTPALRFYQKRGFTLVAVYRNAIAESRKLKPEIPLVGVDGIPIRDEMEMELLLR
ncbi:MAG: GNAT family N-acetyltransferase [Limnochordia bacterium]|nr:GNAT family N-acetyltransferase [Limnochordia bacterium]HPZ31613.1 GNAT family N-acetyltransferase [Limnochordia bacterium]